MNRRILSFILITFSLLLSILFFGDQLVSMSSEIELATIVGFAAIASGISGVLMSLSTKRVANFEAIREYFQQGDTPEGIKSRNKIYALENEGVTLDEQAASEVCSFFHFWGMMVIKGFLPLWIFKSSSGMSLIRLHHLLQPYIQKRREMNTHYADGFEQLAKMIKKKFKYEYEPVKSRESIEVEIPTEEMVN